MSPSIANARAELARACRRIGRPIQLMEVCGTHTVAVFRSGLKALLPDRFRLISGPGCPVCVTPSSYLDAAVALAARRDVIMTTYGDMVRVPGSAGSLEQQRAEGADVRVVYSVRDAVELAQAHPGREVVFLGVGFETTAPATAAAIRTARDRRLRNFSVLSAHKRVVPAMAALLAAGDCPIDGFLCPGHVSVIIGSDAFRPIVEQYGRSCVVAGFEPPQIMAGLLRLARLLERGRPALENVYSVAVSAGGNPHALRLLEEVFQPAPAVWRALGTIPESGLEIRPEYGLFDAARRFEIHFGPDRPTPGCRCGEVIQGKATPDQCPLFARGCTPLSPVGPCMVSSEGTCAAWFKYNRTPQRTGADGPMEALPMWPPEATP